MGDEDLIFSILQDYKEKLPVPNNEYDYFEEYTYSKWAAQELEVYILSHCHLTPKQAVSSFRDDMLALCEQKFRKNVIFGKSETYRMYSIAYDVASEILAMLKSYI